MTKPIQFSDEVHAQIVAAARAADRYVGAGSKSELGQYVAEACTAYPAAQELAEVCRGILSALNIDQRRVLQAALEKWEKAANEQK